MQIFFPNWQRRSMLDIFILLYINSKDGKRIVMIIVFYFKNKVVLPIFDFLFDLIKTNLTTEVQQSIWRVMWHYARTLRGMLFGYALFFIIMLLFLVDDVNYPNMSNELGGDLCILFFINQVIHTIVFVWAAACGGVYSGSAVLVYEFFFYCSLVILLFFVFAMLFGGDRQK
jgi:hypothetical protein